MPLPDWYLEDSPCSEKALNMALAWYSRVKSLRTAGFDSGIIIDELRLEEFGRRRLGMGDRVIELFIRIMSEFIYVENAFAKDPDWIYGEPVKEKVEDDAESTHDELSSQP